MEHIVKVSFGATISFKVEADDWDEALVRAMDEFQDCDLDEIDDLLYANPATAIREDGKIFDYHSWKEEEINV
ncbi:MAG: hypothetical protein IK016_07180 [Lachnospiraceae bacterium]|nr:hypothetical protein [Lachnospiraceae bacterium]